MIIDLVAKYYMLPIKSMKEILKMDQWCEDLADEIDNLYKQEWLVEKIANTDYMDTEKTCENCKHANLRYYRQPCCACDAGDKWEPNPIEQKL